MSRRAQPDDWLPRIEESRNRRKLLIRQLPKARADHHQVRLLQRSEAGDVFLKVRVHKSAIRIDGKEHCAIVSVLLAEDFREHREGFFRAIFFIAGNEDDALAVGLSLCRKMQPIRRKHGRRQRQNGEERNEWTFHK